MILVALAAVRVAVKCRGFWLSGAEVSELVDARAVERATVGLLARAARREFVARWAA